MHLAPVLRGLVIFVIFMEENSYSWKTELMCVQALTRQILSSRSHNPPNHLEVAVLKELTNKEAEA